MLRQLDEAEKARLRAVFDAMPFERMRVYLDASDRNPYEALALYDQNSKVSAALFETVGHFEIHFRNSLDAALRSRHDFKRRSGDWLDDGHGELSDRALEAINRARADAIRNRRSGHGDHVSGRGHVIAELNFSFWRRLIDRRYERTHGSAVMRLYPELRKLGRNNADMEPLRVLVEPIYSLRNRIAHHEPVWRQSATRRRDDMVQVIGQTSPELASWVRSTCRLDTLVKAAGVAPSGSAARPLHR
ncbi:Abi-like protein [Curtobacterium sp. 314Chir4.1]|uniref:Abi family protein n=1 Tax=Curtobacterium sp. 314Chir4.1 TaxID=1279028 RepID=UPI000BD90B86|nr:Abi family protein [Curtobacterium sp. 314Chir4.1]SOC89690.1 Abi-like protein [Curtobacterium sp. 314Chir4.1]